MSNYGLIWTKKWEITINLPSNRYNYDEKSILEQAPVQKIGQLSYLTLVHVDGLFYFGSDLISKTCGFEVRLILLKPTQLRRPRYRQKRLCSLQNQDIPFCCTRKHSHKIVHKFMYSNLNKVGHIKVHFCRLKFCICRRFLLQMDISQVTLFLKQELFFLFCGPVSPLLRYCSAFHYTIHFNT